MTGTDSWWEVPKEIEKAESTVPPKVRRRERWRATAREVGWVTYWGVSSAESSGSWKETGMVRRWDQ